MAQMHFVEISVHRMPQSLFFLLPHLSVVYFCDKLDLKCVDVLVCCTVMLVSKQYQCVVDFIAS